MSVLPFFIGKANMRALQTHDIFVAMNIINTAGIREKFSEIALKVSAGKDVNLQEIGLDFLLSVLGGCANAKSENLIYEFLGGVLEMSPNEIKTMEPLKLIEEIKKLNEVISVEQWKSFFQSLSVMIRK